LEERKLSGETGGWKGMRLGFELGSRMARRGRGRRRRTEEGKGVERVRGGEFLFVFFVALTSRLTLGADSFSFFSPLFFWHRSTI